MHWEKRKWWLLAVNLLAIPVLSVPSFGFIAYMNLRGVPTFIAVAWAGVALASFLLWPSVLAKPRLTASAMALAAALLPVVVAWAIALHTLYWRPGDGLVELARWARDAILLGGLFTGGYWLPASVVNYLVLRHQPNRSVEPTRTKTRAAHA